MTNPEQTRDESLAKPGVESNVPVQNGSDEVYDRPTPRGKNTILLISLILVVVAAVLASLYLF